MAHQHRSADSVHSILMISYFAPSRGHAGGLRLLDLYGEIRRLRPDVHLALVNFRHSDDAFEDALCKSIFDEVHSISASDLSPNVLGMIRFQRDHYDVIDLQYHQCGALQRASRKKWPVAVISFSPMESFLRAGIVFLLGGFRGSRQLFKDALGLVKNLLDELKYILRADQVITVSDADLDTIARFKSSKNVFCVPTCLSQFEFSNAGHESRKSGQPVVVFFAYFGSQTNRDALKWYLEYVHPRVIDEVPGYCLHVVGRGLSLEFEEQFSKVGVKFVGYVQNALDGLRDVSLGIAPALSGAGVRGKIHQYAAAGIPCVASSIAYKSLAYVHGESIFVADSPEDFASCCAALLKDENLRMDMGRRAYGLCMEKYTWPAITDRIKLAYHI